MSLGPYMVSTGAVAAVIALAHLIPDLGRLANVSMLFLGAVLLSAVLYGVEIAIFASLLAFMAYNFFFTQPYYTLQVEHWSDLLALLVFLIVAIVTGTLAGVCACRYAPRRRAWPPCRRSMILRAGWVPQ